MSIQVVDAIFFSSAMIASSIKLLCMYRYTYVFSAFLFALCQDSVRQNKLEAHTILFPKSAPIQIVTRDTLCYRLPICGLRATLVLLYNTVL
jgi:hypothetical protein